MSVTASDDNSACAVGLGIMEHAYATEIPCVWGMHLLDV